MSAFKRNHYPHLAGIIVPTFRCNACGRSWVWWCPRARPCRLASSRLFICCCTSGRLISALMAALSALILCSRMLRNGLYRNSFLSSVFCPGSAGLWWSGAPSYINMMFSLGSIFSLVWAKTSLNLCMHNTNNSWREYETIGWRNGKCHGNATVSLRPLCPHTCLYPVSDSGSSLVSGSPYIVAAFVDQTQWFNTACLVDQLA